MLFKATGNTLSIMFKLWVHKDKVKGNDKAELLINVSYVVSFSYSEVMADEETQSKIVVMKKKIKK